MCELEVNDEDTTKLLEIAIWNLQRFFGLTEPLSRKLVAGFYNRFHELWSDDFYHEEMPYRVAARVYFVMHLGRKNSEFGNWFYDSPWRDTPQEAITYFREAYFDPD